MPTEITPEQREALTGIIRAAALLRAHREAAHKEDGPDA